MKRILFVDDESRILDAIKRMLHADRSRWNMEFVLSGEAALQACEEHSFDVVISDMRMPGMDGVALLGQIRDRFPNTARIILSGYSEGDLVTGAISMAHRFLAKPCGASDLRDTIERLCTLQELVGSPEIRKIAGGVGELPSLSATYTRLTAAVGDPGSTIAQIADIIGRDAAMSAKILQLSNSAFFGLSQTVASLASAVSYLGMDTIKTLALASEAFRMFKPDPRIPPSDCEDIQSHALKAASIAGILPLRPRDREFAVAAALLHDIGILFLASALPDQYCAIRSLVSESGCTRVEAEERLLGTSHAEIGAYLLGLWGLPNVVVEAIAHHHRPTRIPHSNLDCTSAVYLADLLANECEAPPPDTAGYEIGESERACLETLGIWSTYREIREIAIEKYKPTSV